MTIDTPRIARDVATIGAITATPGAGGTRPTFSADWRRAVDYVVNEARAAGCDVRTDAAGNVHCRPASLAPDAPVWLSGSHLDTVPHGGDWDGVIGVVAPLEVLRAAHATGEAVPLELVIFAEEEGTTFGLGMIGSRLWAGDLTADALAGLRNADGRTYLEAGADRGVDPSRLAAETIDGRNYLGLVEVHAEQGPGMWNAGTALAVVTAVAGRRQYRAAFEGEANHAGSTSMGDRRDALAAAAEVIAKLELLAKDLGDRDGGRAVCTVGRLAVEPNAVNVVPGRVAFTIDLRSPDDDVLARGDRVIGGLVTAVANARGLAHQLDRTESQPATPLDADLCARLRRCCLATGAAPSFGRVPTAVSGALHDAAILAPKLPTAMLFVPSERGVSHNPAELSRAEDVASAARVLAELVSGETP